MSQPEPPKDPQDEVYQAQSDPNPYQSSAVSGGPANPPQGYPSAPPKGDATGGLIPYKNVPALIGYYMGVGSLIPCIGLALAPFAIVLGILGLVKKKKMPEAKGSAHAIVAIVLGILSLLVYGGATIWFLIDMSSF